MKTYLTLLITSLFFSSCTSKPTYELNTNAYSFSVDQVSELKLSRRYVGEEPWTITLKKADDWLVSSAPQTLIDNFADENFIHHFLDTLRSIKPYEIAPKGNLSTYGLEPPRFIAQWSTGLKTFTLQLGETFSGKSQFALFEKNTPVMLIQGSATQQMLDYVENWQYFRKKPLTLWEPDDVDVIKINSIELVRAGLDWEYNEKSLGESFSKLFERWMHLRIKRFIDDPAENQKLSKESLKLTPQTIVLLNRKNKEQKVVWFTKGNRIFAKNILRGDTWAELHPAAEKTYRQLTLRALTHAESTPVKSEIK